MPHPAASTLRALCAAYPETTEDHPWGETAYKVRGKVFCFAFIGEHEGVARVSVTLKLPISRGVALLDPAAQPTGYGLGRAGWVTFRWPAAEAPDLAAFAGWIDESWRAVAPKRLAATVPPSDAPAPPPGAGGDGSAPR